MTGFSQPCRQRARPPPPPAQAQNERPTQETVPSYDTSADSVNACLLQRRPSHRYTRSPPVAAMHKVAAPQLRETLPSRAGTARRRCQVPETLWYAAPDRATARHRAADQHETPVRSV
jgi:hypothetical protein